MPTKSSKIEFVSRSEKIHNNKYNYSLVDYKNCSTKVKIICPYHGIFEQTPTNHLNNHPCKKCSRNIISKSQRKNIEFINNANKKYDKKYDYSKVQYINRMSKVIIICPIHGDFLSTPINHLSRNGCSKCSKLEIRKRNKIRFIEKSISCHSGKYDYSLVEYISDKKKVKIMCQKHGIFYQQPNTHINGVGCPSCSSSKGELKILKYLQDKKIRFEKERKFENCSFVNDLIFDFYLPDKNTCIEFDGKQHFNSIKFFGGEECLNKTILRDKIKNTYCKANNIKLVRIPYYDYDKIEKILENIWENY